MKLIVDTDKPLEEQIPELRARLETAWRRGFMECASYLKTEYGIKTAWFFHQILTGNTFQHYLAEGKDKEFEP